MVIINHINIIHDVDVYIYAHNMNNYNQTTSSYKL